MEDVSIRWGILGCGDVAEKKSGPAFRSINGSELVAVMRRDASKAEDYARRHYISRWYNDIDQFFLDDQINAVYVATPPSCHKQHAITALEKGFDVYLEKPVALNAKEAEEIMESLKLSPGNLCVAHYRRSLPLFTRVKEILRSNIIGDVFSCDIKLWQRKPCNTGAENWRLDPSVSGGGLFHDLSPHQLDILLFLFGNPTFFQGMATTHMKSTPGSPVDHVSGMALFDHCVVFNGSWCFCVDPAQEIDECIITGSLGCIRFSFFGPSSDLVVTSRKLDVGGAIFEAGGTATTSETFIHPSVIQTPMIEAAVEYFKFKRMERDVATSSSNEDNASCAPISVVNNPCSLEEAIVVMKMIDAFTSVPISNKK